MEAAGYCVHCAAPPRREDRPEDYRIRLLKLVFGIALLVVLGFLWIRYTHQYRSPFR
jgi:hypothetical protein